MIPNINMYFRGQTEFLTLQLVLGFNKFFRDFVVWKWLLSMNKQIDIKNAIKS